MYYINILCWSTIVRHYVSFLTWEWKGLEPATSESQVHRLNHYTTGLVMLNVPRPPPAAEGGVADLEVLKDS